MTTDRVPGMAEAIDARRLELGLTIGNFADAAGLTRQGLDPVRQGLRRQYNDRTILGVARALRWPIDWLDQLEAGRTPEPQNAPAGDEDWNDLKSSLSPEDRAAVRAIIESLRARS